MLEVAELSRLFERAGVRRGMDLIVHASYKSLGPVREGPLGVVRALMRLLGPEGTLIMPSFYFDDVELKGDFDQKNSPSSVGAISEAFRHVPGVVRSCHPTHAYAAWGRNARDYVRGHLRTLTVGEDSPLGKLARRNGYQLNIGTRHKTSTIKHLTEVLHRVPCLGYRGSARRVIHESGCILPARTWTWRSKACPLTEKGEFIEKLMDEKGWQRRLSMALGDLTFFKLRDLLLVVDELLREGHASVPPCRECQIRPTVKDTIVPTDWKEDLEKLKAVKREFGLSEKL